MESNCDWSSPASQPCTLVYAACPSLNTRVSIYAPDVQPTAPLRQKKRQGATITSVSRTANFCSTVAAARGTVEVLCGPYRTNNLSCCWRRGRITQCHSRASVMSCALIPFGHPEMAAREKTGYTPW